MFKKIDETTRKFLSIRDLGVIYASSRETVHAVNGISFDMDKGETLALVDETGAGRTTTAKAILGTLPNPPAGLKQERIILKGEDLLKKPTKEILKIRGGEITMIFQDPMTALNPIITVGEQIVEGLLLRNDYTRREAEGEAGKILELVRIPAERFAEYPFEFPGDIKQRVVVAVTLACSPDLLLADEPTTALDVTIRVQVLDLIKDLKVKYNASILLITHDLGVVTETNNRAAMIYAGEILRYGNREDIFLHPSHPYTVSLFHSPPGTNSQARQLKPTTGSPPDPADLSKGCAFAPRCPHARGGCNKGKIEFREVAPDHFCRYDLKQRED